MSKLINPIVRKYGGQHYLLPILLPLIDNTLHRVFVDAYGGTGTITLNKRPGALDVYNDIDWRHTNLFRMLRDDPAEFQRLLTLTPYSHNSFGDAQTTLSDTSVTPSIAEAAVAFYVVCRQSFNALGKHWAPSKGRIRRGMSDVVSGWLSSIDENLPRIIERLREIQIHGDAALNLLPEFDSPDALWYLDPPFPHDSRGKGTTTAYGDYEIPRDGHAAILKFISAPDRKARIILSSQPSEQYTDWFASPDQAKWQPFHYICNSNMPSITHAARRTQVFWLNFTPPAPFLEKLRG